MKKIIDEFTGLGLSRQRMWQLRCIRDGKCYACGAKTRRKQPCRKCRDRRRAKLGHAPWKKGGPGRPPHK